MRRLSPSPRDARVRARALLLASARKRECVTYGLLMRTFGISRGRGITRLIGEVDRGEYERGAPGFAAIIVRKDTHFPGGGYFCGSDVPRRFRRPPSRSSDPKLSSAEKNYVKRRQRELWTHYGRSKKVGR